MNTVLTHLSREHFPRESDQPGIPHRGAYRQSLSRDLEIVDVQGVQRRHLCLQISIDVGAGGGVGEQAEGGEGHVVGLCDVAVAAGEGLGEYQLGGVGGAYALYLVELGADAEEVVVVDDEGAHQHSHPGGALDNRRTCR